MMSRRVLEEAIENLRRLRDHIEEIADHPAPMVCGLCLKPLGDGGHCSFMEFPAWFHMRCIDWMRLREVEVALGHLERRAPRFARRWLQREHTALQQQIADARKAVEEP